MHIPTTKVQATNISKTHSNPFFSRGVGLLNISLLFFLEGTENGEVRNVEREKCGRREMIE